MRTIAVLGLLIFGACESGAAKPPNKNDPPSKPRDAAMAVPVADADPGGLQGQALYTTFCAQCHGADAKGYKSDNAPSLVNKTFLESATDAFIAQSIAQGRPGTSMAPYAKEVGGPLDRAAIDRIVAWLRAQGPQSVALGTVAKGDPARGAPIYARECAKCHGEANVRATAVHLANQQFLAAASDAFIRYAIMSGRPGTPMASFVTTLKPEEIDDVVAYIRGYAQGGVEGTLPAPTGKEPVVINPGGKDPVWKKLRSDPNSTVGRYVSVEEVNAALAAKKKMVIIDARPQSDWMRVHITGAVSIPYHEVDKLASVPNDTWAIAYCACPHHLSGIVVDELIKRGHKKALVLDEGILEWHRRGYPVTAAPGVEPPPKETPPGAAPTAMPGHEGHGY
jgi:mono/diheme cytochrome c family protein/rhodanese-related sulfurtransferase